MCFCRADPDVLSKYAGLAAVCDPAAAAELGAQLPRADGLSAAELDALENTNIGGLNGWGLAGRSPECAVMCVDL